MTPQTPPTDRPLTAGDVTLKATINYSGSRMSDLLIGGWKVQISNGCLQTATIARPATSAASDGGVGLDAIRSEIEEALDRNGLAERGWTKKAIDEAIAAVPTRSRFSKAEAGVVMPIIERILAALASPPVSERERELEGALDLCSAALQRLHTDIEALMTDSEGVAGLHRNGEIAPWSDLQEGGSYADWLGEPLWAARNAWTDARLALTAQPAGEGK